ncbi:hypothetical protein C2845_PM07G10530 [Panicum miliaceum]|uniref:Uncharacterized protein n=1 Tax=Panicum miliaceum TaxID=4540 RepID=A0A3L6SJL5_PANMI|nr:hypothetical protein C2845_PM07G10530 [Panicum miliaceum]
MAVAEAAPAPEASSFYAGAGGLSTGWKLVPWSSWEEWSFVRDGLFSPFPAAALRRHATRSLPFVFLATDAIHCFGKLHRRGTAPDPNSITVPANRRLHKCGGRKRGVVCSTTVGSKRRRKHIDHIFLRGSVLIPVDVTATFVEIQLRDPFFRSRLAGDDAMESQEMLAMLYSMAIMTS